MHGLIPGSPYVPAIAAKDGFSGVPVAPESNLDTTFPLRNSVICSTDTHSLRKIIFEWYLGQRGRIGQFLVTVYLQR